MVRDNPDLTKVVTNVGPDQQGTAHQLAQDHARAVADDAARRQEAARQEPTVIRGDVEPTVRKDI